MDILATRIHSLRKEKHIRQEDAAKELGISTRTYCRYETGEREPTAPTIVALADLFGVSADYLLGRSDER
ncbi:hypothetical protein CE91St41_38290 [Oscillospiraceae bacterium]|nr:hypothetical protein CE91St40_38270 [Oscillospiraceae bacterium]BDF76940.1 hypothetical protein CE91St41_38290 [Oscillospiraceae bacterium]